MSRPEALSIVIDSREPTWVKELSFGSTPSSVATLPTGDVWVALADATLVIERKTMSDLLGSIKDGRLFSQAAEMINSSKWAYVVLHDQVHLRNGQIMVGGSQTAWTWGSVEGALLKVQEIGASIVLTMNNTPQGFKQAIVRLANHDRGPITVKRKREVKESFPGMDLLTSIKGVSEIRANQLLDTYGTAAYALVGLQTQRDKWPIKGFPWKSLTANARLALGLTGTSELTIIKGDKK